MEEKIATLIEQIPFGILTFSSSGEVEFTNQKFRKLCILHNLPLSYQQVNIFEDNFFYELNIIQQLNDIFKGIPFQKLIAQKKIGNGGKISLVLRGFPLLDEDKIIGGMLFIDEFKHPVDNENGLLYFDKHINSSAAAINSFFLVTSHTGTIQSTFGEINSKIINSSESLTGKNILEVINPTLTHLLVKNYNETFRKKQTISFQFDLEVENGIENYECRLEPQINSSGKVELIYFFINKLVYENLTPSSGIEELKYHQIACSYLKYGLFTTDRNGRIKCWYSNSQQFFNLTAEQVTGKFLGEFFKFITPENFSEALKDIEQKRISKLSGNFRGEQNSLLHLEISILAFNDDRDTFLFIARNLEEKIKKTEQRILTQEYLENLLNSSEVPVCKIDANGTILISNPAFKATLGYPDIELYRTNFLGLINSDEKRKDYIDITAVRNGTIKETTLNLVAFNRNIKSFLVKFIPEDETDPYRNYYCHLTEVKKIEETPAELFLYKSLFTASQDGIAVIFAGNIVIANNSFAKIFGFKEAADIYNKKLLEFVSEEDSSKVLEYLRLKEEKKNGPERFEFLAKKKDGSNFFAELSVAGFSDADKNYLVIVARDVTEHKRAQRVIRESEQKYRNITENIDDFLYTFERTGKYLRPLFYTSAVEKITGYSQAEFLSDPKLLLKIIHPDDLAQLKNKLSVLWKSGIHSSSELEFRILSKSGNIVWVRNKVNIIRDKDSSIQKIYGLVSDITLRKRAEEELKESAANLKKINDAKDRFLSIISHDLRTPFSSILGFTDLLLTDESLSELESKQYVKYIQDSSKSMLALVNSLLDWTRLQTGRIKFEPENLNARKLVEDAVSTSAGMALQKQIEIEIMIDPLMYVFVDKNLAYQAFGNLISNAIKFSSKNEKIVISAKPEGKSRFLRFSVKDFGRGIKPENLPKLFNIDMKFTTDGTAGEKGSGLGLSLVKEIIEKHGGSITVKSEIGKGSEFLFTFPVSSNKILIIDNNKTDRILYSKILKNITPDYQVDIASNGREALELIATSPPAIVITENDMPVMNGYAFVSEMIRLNLLQKIPVVVLSGNIDRNISQDYAELGIEYIFQKPVNLKDFKTAVEKSIRKGITGNSHIT